MTLKILYIAISLLLITSCATVSEQSAKDADYYYKLGVAYYNEGNMKQAYIDFQKAIDIDPNHKEALNDLGLVYIKLEDFQKSKEFFNRAITVDSNFSDAHNNLGIVYMHERLWENAISSFLIALKNPFYHSPDLVYLNIGFAHYRAGRYDEAIKAFKSAILRNPDLLRAIYGLSLAYNKAGNYGMSALVFKDAIDKDPLYKGNIEKFINDAKQKLAFAKDEDAEDLEDFLEIIKY